MLVSLTFSLWINQAVNYYSFNQLLMVLTIKIKKLIDEYNVNYRANTMLYKEKDVAALIKANYNVDRFNFLKRMNQIERELVTLLAHLDGENAIVTTREGECVQGKIEIANKIPFLDFDNEEGKPEMTLWVETGHRRTSQLYAADKIIILCTK